MNFFAVATCLFGLEKTVSFEMKKAGAENVFLENGRVFFEGDGGVVARANVWSRTAERILILLKRFPASDFDARFDAVHEIPWSDYIDRTDAFPVKGYSMGSRLSSVPALQSVIKKAVAERLKKDYQSPFLTEKSGVTKRIRFSVVKDQAVMMLDTSGDGLHKRGYRPLSHEAPIKETLAAGMVDFARIDRDGMAADPFCGSGTIVIEAAMRAMNLAPGLNRPFAGEDYRFLGDHVFRDVKAEAREAVRKDAAFCGRGSDIDPEAVETAKRNAARAGVSGSVTFETKDARAFVPSKEETVLANPPYGERMMTEAEAEEVARGFFLRIPPGSCRSAYVISSHPDFERVTGRKAQRRRKLYNGMIPCQLYMYF